MQKYKINLQLFPHTPRDFFSFLSIQFVRYQSQLISNKKTKQLQNFSLNVLQVLNINLLID